MFKNILFLFILFASFHGYGQIIKSWILDSFQVNLIRYELVQETPGIFPIDRHSTKAFYSLFEIKKQAKLVKLGGNYSLSKDTCFINFFELPEPRIKNGKVGTFYKLGLCNNKITANTISKPTWNYNEISNVTIRPLDSLYFNPYNPHEPYIVPHFDKGKKMELHPKMIEGFLLFFNETYIIAPYDENEFPSPHNPHFEINFTHHGVEKSVLLYWGKYIADGYVYNSGGSYIEPSDLRFWEANLKLLGIK